MPAYTVTAFARLFNDPWTAMTSKGQGYLCIKSTRLKFASNIFDYRPIWDTSKIIDILWDT